MDIFVISFKCFLSTKKAVFFCGLKRRNNVLFKKKRIFTRNISLLKSICLKYPWLKKQSEWRWFRITNFFSQENIPAPLTQLKYPSHWNSFPLSGQKVYVRLRAVWFILRDFPYLSLATFWHILYDQVVRFICATFGRRSWEWIFLFP